MRRAPILFLALAMSLGAAWAVSAQTHSAQDILDLIDVRLAADYADMDIALVALENAGPYGGGMTPALHDRIDHAAKDGVAVLDVLPSAPCYADYWMVAHYGFWALSQWADLFTLAEKLDDAKDADGRDQALEEAGRATSGMSAVMWSKTLRTRTTCGPQPTEGVLITPPPRKTSTPVQNPQTSPSIGPSPSSTPEA
jgi:hypothetical protein